MVSKFNVVSSTQPATTATVSVIAVRALNRASWIGSASLAVGMKSTRWERSADMLALFARAADRVCAGSAIGCSSGAISATREADNDRDAAEIDSRSAA